MAKTKTVGANVDPKVIEDLDVLARRASLAERREVTRSDIVRFLLEEGIERHEITDGERTTFRRRGMPSFPKESVARAKLRPRLDVVVDEVEEDDWLSVFTTLGPIGVFALAALSMPAQAMTTPAAIEVANDTLEGAESTMEGELAPLLHLKCGLGESDRCEAVAAPSAGSNDSRYLVPQIGLMDYKPDPQRADDEEAA